MEGLGRRLNALRVCVTRGRDGAALWCGEDARTDDGGGGTTAFHEHSGYCHLPPPGGSDDGDGGGGDSVGAGDAFLAAMVYSLLVRGEPPERALERGLWWPSTTSFPGRPVRRSRPRSGARCG